MPGTVAPDGGAGSPRRHHSPVRAAVPGRDYPGAAPTRQRWFASGACQRLVLEILRDAPEPLLDAAVAAEVARRQQVPEGPEVLASVHKTTLAVLRRLTSGAPA